MVKIRTLLCALAVLAVLILASACSSGSGGSTSIGGGGGGGGGGDAASFCAKIKKYNSEGVTSDIQDQKAVDALEDVEKSAPAEIKDDVKYLVGVAKKLASIDTNDLAAIESAAKTLDTDKLSSTSERLDSYTEKHCHLNLDT